MTTHVLFFVNLPVLRGKGPR